MRGLKLNKQSVITNRTENMGRYFSELSKMYCISPESEHELSMTIRANTSTSEVSKAIEKLVCANLRFIKVRVGDYWGHVTDSGEFTSYEDEAYWMVEL